MTRRSGYDSGGETPGENTEDVQAVRSFLRGQSGKKPEPTEDKEKDKEDGSDD